MKVCLICDTHWGVRGDNIAFLDANKEFVDTVFLPELQKRQIHRIFHLGDLVDKRKNINFLTAHRLHIDFLERISHRGIHMTVVAGNHDTYHKTTNQINALSELLKLYEVVGKIDYVTEAVNYSVDGTEILLVPWICADNRERTLAAIASSKSKICLGHLELAGYQMYKGVVNEHGDDRELFRQFSFVGTGHYHHRSTSGNIHYLGSHGQFTWSDYGDQRGFHIFDLETLELEFIANPYQMFLKIGYDDTISEPVFNLDTNLALDPNEVESKYVKIVIRNKSNNRAFDKFLAAIQELKPLDIQIIDEAFNVDSEQPAEILQSQDTLTIFKNHIDTLDNIDVPREDLERLFINLYQQANEVA